MYVTYDVNPDFFTQYRTIISKFNNEPVFATPLELKRLLQYADKLKSSAHERAHPKNNSSEGGPGGGARQVWAQGPTSKLLEAQSGEEQTGTREAALVQTKPDPELEVGA